MDISYFLSFTSSRPRSKVYGNGMTRNRKYFKRLKSALTSAPILIHFNPLYDTILETDASNDIATDVMNQKDTDRFYHPIAFYSKTFSLTEMNYPIHNKELLAVRLILKK